MTINMSHRYYNLRKRLVVCPLMLANIHMMDLKELIAYHEWYWQQWPKIWLVGKEYIRLFSEILHQTSFLHFKLWATMQALFSSLGTSRL